MLDLSVFAGQSSPAAPAKGPQPSQSDLLMAAADHVERMQAQMQYPEIVLSDKAQKADREGDYTISYDEIHNHMHKNMKEGDKFFLKGLDNQKRLYQYLGKGKGGENDFIKVDQPKEYLGF